MPRRVSLPAADDLFRPTSPTEDPAATGGAAVDRDGAADAAPAETGAPAARSARRPRAVRSVPAPAQPSGRIRHDEKMTVYVTSEELLALEQARLTLRAAHGLGVDRGRLVREAVALVLADLAEHGEESVLVRRLREA